MERKHMIVAAAVAALLMFFIWRRKAHASPGLSMSIPPSPQSAITTLMSTPPSQLAVAAVNYGVSQLPVVGAGNLAVIPQSTPKPTPICPAGYVGPNPGDPSLYCSGGGTKVMGVNLSTLLPTIQKSVNYNPSAGYYG